VTGDRVTGDRVTGVLTPAPPVAVMVRRTEGADPSVPLPDYQTALAAGMDVRANLAAADRDTGLTIAAGRLAAVPTGLALAIPPGFEIQVRPRSGLALRHGLTVANAPGTIDADYRGEVAVILMNLGRADFTIRHGDRIAQLVLAPVTRCLWEPVAVLPDSVRGAGGFGSTGL
jgi:dUTP pyrophosphatase